jgi:hypothetical protein
MGRKKKQIEHQTEFKEESFVMPSDEPSLAEKKFLNESDLRWIESISHKEKVSRLNSEIAALKIKNTELTISNLQVNLEKLRLELVKHVEETKSHKEDGKKHFQAIRDKYEISGKFGYDPLTGELITE